jgi:hypothetical protein
MKNSIKYDFVPPAMTFISFCILYDLEKSFVKIGLNG